MFNLHRQIGTGYFKSQQFEAHGRSYDLNLRRSTWTDHRVQHVIAVVTVGRATVRLYGLRWPLVTA